MNEVLRDAYVEDCQRGVDEVGTAPSPRNGVAFELRSYRARRFHRHIGIYAGVSADLQGNLLAKDEWEKKKPEWLPSETDKAFVQSLMTKAVSDPTQMANWISAPKQGIKGRPVDFEYVRHSEA